MLKKLRRAVRSFEQKFEKRGYRSPLKKHRSLSQKVSLIVPTYNVEPYIGEFLASVTSQTTGLRNLEVIIVDDGSTDRSGEIAQAWAKRYPNTIRYIRQENKGAAEARNTGLGYARGDWVGFPDPDDILPRKWLATFNEELQRQHALPPLIVSMPIRIFREKTGKTTKTHPLNRLYLTRQVVSTDDLGDYILLSAAKSFFHRAQIEKLGLRFDERVRPSFEDGHFTTRLIAFSPQRSIIRLPKPGYIYRKREAGTSQLDGVATDPRWFTDQLRYGYIDLIRQTKDDHGKVPRFVQRTILYSLAWRFSHLLDQPERTATLTAKQRADFLSLLSEITTYIESDTIRTMNLGGLHERIKVGILSKFTGKSRGNDFVYLQQYDRHDDALQFRWYSGADRPATVTIFIDGEPAQKEFETRVVSTLLSEPFCVEHRFWIRRPSAELAATIDGRPARFWGGGALLGDRISTEEAISSVQPRSTNAKSLPDTARQLRSYASSEGVRARFLGCVVLMDRDDAADDNAEHLYRYMLQNGYAENAYFILREGSYDWRRLETEGFKLLPYGSNDHVAAIVNASVVASSHADQFVLWPVEKSWIQDLVQHQFVFLQHGVIHNDLSGWLNSKRIRLFVTAAEDEYKSIAAPDSDYHFSPRETKLTGLPRHDALLSRSQHNDTILVMPTWRRYLLSNPAALGAEREQMATVLQSRYAQAWKEFLTCDSLKILAAKHSKKIVFCPHSNMAMHLNDLELPGYIECRDPLTLPTMQEAFAEAAVMVTDYSSTAFECAYINKSVVYYQFDRDEFFSGAHPCKAGYFDFQQHGFGPVANSQEQVLDAIKRALEGGEDPVYAQRRESFFAFRDGRCCERVYNAICELLPEEAVAGQIAAE